MRTNAFDILCTVAVILACIYFGYHVTASPEFPIAGKVIIDTIFVIGCISLVKDILPQRT